MAFKVPPIYARGLILFWKRTTFKVVAIQIASVACLKPPATSVIVRTRLVVDIVVPVFSAELHSNVMFHRITYTDNTASHRHLDGAAVAK